jgi:hypothetical protein
MRIHLARPAVALALIAGGMSVLPMGVGAQSPSANVRASVEVAPPPILLENLRNLQFGTVTLGQVVTVNALGPHTAGTISAGARFANIRKTSDYNLRFGLPGHLVNGSSSIPVTWTGTQFGSLCIWSNTAATCDAVERSFSPQAHTSTPLLIIIPNSSPSNNFSADVYLGGRLEVPSSSLIPGVYTGTITIFLTAVS